MSCYNKSGAAHVDRESDLEQKEKERMYKENRIEDREKEKIKVDRSRI